MKIFLLPIIIFLSACLGLALAIFELANLSAGSQHEQNNISNKYVSKKYGYEIVVPAGFTVRDELPDLVSIEKGEIRTRINAGCYESGTENLQPTVEQLTLNGIPALMEKYYNGSALKLRRVAMTGPVNKCFFLEEVANSEQGWRELQSLRKTFRFVN